MSQGYSLADLDSLHRYISYNAPIIIHIHADSHFKYFMKDTHYRNQFETKMSSGGYGISARATWENRMFDKKHAKATDFERVKYGVLNITNDPCGVHACSCYG